MRDSFSRRDSSRRTLLLAASVAGTLSSRIDGIARIVAVPSSTEVFASSTTGIAARGFLAANGSYPFQRALAVIDAP